MRSRTITLLLGVALAALALLVTPAYAQEDDDHGEVSDLPDVTVPDGSVSIGDGISISGAVITPLDGGAPRALDATQAAAFTQSVLATAFYGAPGIKGDPPAELPVYRVEISGSWGLAEGVLTVHYAEDGTTPYAAFPGLDITPTTVVPPPEPSNWFTGPEAMYLAFNGRGEVADTLGTQQATSTTTEEGSSDDPPAGSNEDDSPVSGIVVGVVAAAVLIGGGLWLRGRRRGEDPGEPDDTDEPVNAGVAP